MRRSLLFLLFLFVVAPAGAPLAAQGVAAAADPTPILGIWEGRLALPGGSLRMLVHLTLSDEGELRAAMDSPDQGATGIPVAAATFAEGHLVLEITAVGGRLEGTLDGPDRLSARFIQGGMELPLELERVEEASRPNRPQNPEPPFPYHSEDVRYPNPLADIRLAGTLTLPEGEGPFPAAVLISGSGPQNRDSEVFGHAIFRVLADHLTRAGIAVLRSDDRGVAESEGDFAAATSEDFAGDAAAAVAYLRTRPEIDWEGIGLVGMSEGGLIAPLVSANHGDVDFLVLLAGPGVAGDEIVLLQSELISRAGGASDEMRAATRELQERLFEVVRAEPDAEARAVRLEAELRAILAGIPAGDRPAMGIPPSGEEGWVQAQLSALRGPWFRYFLQHDPEPVLRRVRVPVLALNGALDLQVDPAQNLPVIERALLEGGNPDVTAEVLPGLNHLFQTAGTGSPAEYAGIEETMAPAAMERVSGWILARFGPGRSPPG